MMARGRPVVSVLLVGMAVSAGCAAAATGGAPAAVHDALQQRQSECAAALAARDVERTVACFADDAVVHAAGMPAVQGRDAIGRFYTNVFGFMSASHATMESTSLAAAGDMAWEVGRTTNVFRGADGAVEYAGKYVIVWERRDRWRIVAYSLSSNER
jgi:ketosteroid isomerase-like protein